MAIFGKKMRVENGRHFKRFEANYLIKHQIAGSEGEPNISNIRDISAGGVRFWTDAVYPEGALLRVSFVVPPIGRVMEALARVIRARHVNPPAISYFVAANFVEISREDQLALNDFIENIYQSRKGKSFVRHADTVIRMEISQHV